MTRSNAHVWASTFSSTGIVVLCGIATGILTARLLHAEGRGALAAVLLWPQILAEVGLLGVHEALTQRLAAQKSGFEDAVATALTLCAVLSCLAAAIGYLLVPTLLGPDRTHLYGLARLFAIVVIPVNFVTLALYAIDHGRLRFGRYNLSRLGLPVTYTLGLCGLWFFGSTRLETIVAVNLTASLVALLVAAYAVRDTVRIGFKRVEAKIQLSLIWQFNLTAILFAMSSQADRLIVVKFWDDKSVGVYAVALTLSATVARSLAFSFHTVVFPSIASRTANEQRDYLAASLRQIMLLTSLSMLALIAVTPWLVPFAFGSEFAAATGLTMVLILAQVPGTLRQVIVRALRGLGEGKPGSVAEAVTGVAFLAGAVPLMRWLGLSGVAWALVAANLTSLGYAAWYLKRRLQLEPRDWFGLNLRTVAETISYGRSMMAKVTA